MVPKAQVIPFQSVSLRTRGGSPHGDPRPLEVGRVGARERLHSQGRSPGASSLTLRAGWFVGLYHPAVSAPHRIETPRRPLFRDVPVRAVRTVGFGPKAEPVDRTPLMGFIDHPFADTTIAASTPAWAVAHASVLDCHIQDMFRSCRSSRLQRFSPQGVDPKTHPFDSSRVCCTPQPAVGFTTFPCRPDPKIRSSTFPVANTLRSVPLLGSLGPYRHRAASFRTRSRSPAGVPSRRSNRIRLRVATLRLASRRPQGLVPPRSPLQTSSVSAVRRSMLPWALDRLVSRCCRACRAAQLALDVSPRGYDPLRRPRPEKSREGKVFRLCLAPCVRCARRPEGRVCRYSSLAARRLLRCRPARSFFPRREKLIRIGRVGSGSSRKKRLGRIVRIPKDPAMPVDPPRGEAPPRRSVSPEGARSPTKSQPVSEETLRDPAHDPEGRRRWFELVPRTLPRLPAAQCRARSPPTSERPKALVVRAPLAPTSRRTLRRTRARDPRRNRIAQAGRWSHPKVVPGRLMAPVHASKLVRPVSGQTVIVFIRTAWDLTPKNETRLPTRRSGARRRSAGGAVV